MSDNYKKIDRSFVNPYNFVSINRKKIKQENVNEKYKDKEVLHTGYLDCVLVTKTPLVIPDLPEYIENGEEDMHDFFSIGSKKGKKYAIPGSSLRGMLRSVYETVTDSCLSTMKPETHLFTRAGAEGKETFEPGILKEEDGEWKLYSAKTHKIPSKTEIKNGIRYIIKDNTQFRMGDSIKIQKNESEQDASEQYVYVGEAFSNKKFERVFELEEPEVNGLRKNAVKNAMQLLEETLKVYRKKAINKMYPDKHTGYADYEYAKEKNKVIPIWYKIDEKTKRVKLSMACIGRIGYYNTLDDLVKKKVPCQNRAKLCSACSLFGMAGEEATGGRIRITDARAEGAIKWRKNVKLKTLATPRYSYWPFYAKTNSCKYPSNYENPEVEIRGRKYYWHIPEAAHNSQIYEDLRLEEDINKKMQSGYFNLADTGSEFRFRIYYDQVTAEQLDELKWTLCLGENQLESNLCHKLGRGKPLGLGSVKICVLSQTERKLYPEYHLETEENVERLAGKLYKEDKEVDELKRISDFNSMENKTVEYPSILPSKKLQNENTLKKNDLASHHWFSENKSLEKKHEVQCLPEILSKEPYLYYYEYIDKVNSDQYKNNTTKK